MMSSLSPVANMCSLSSSYYTSHSSPLQYIDAGVFASTMGFYAKLLRGTPMGSLGAVRMPPHVYSLWFYFGMCHQKLDRSCLLVQASPAKTPHTLVLINGCRSYQRASDLNPIVGGRLCKSFPSLLQDSVLYAEKGPID